MRNTRRIKNKIGKEAIIFTDNIEVTAYNQIVQLINSEAYKESQIRVMPDVHAGKGCTIGTTMTITDRISPNLVGVDIGCGVLTVELSNKNINFKKLDQVIREFIPSGFSIRRQELSDYKINYKDLVAYKHIDIERARLSMGTLGGGNHFIEVGKDSEENLYLLIHTGSRRFGLEICEHYQKIANRTNLDKDDRDLSYLTGKDYDNYLNDMNIAANYASLNRIAIFETITREMGLGHKSKFDTIHNYIDLDTKPNIVRKGAVSAYKDQPFIIPINMRDGALICVGKGNPDWNYSAPHGAGRVLSRTKARRKLSMDEFKESMKGIYTTSVNKSTLDESPYAYKSMDEIRNTISETADIVKEIKPVYNFKAK